VADKFVVQGHCHLFAVASVAWPVAIRAADMDKVHRPGVAVVRIPEDIYLEGATVAYLVLEVDNAAAEDTVIEGDNFGS
jgi:hypothetical protein